MKEPAKQADSGGWDFPKVLILGTPINQASGGPITLSNLFHEWPADRLAVAHNAFHGNDPGRAKELRLRMEMALPWMRRGIDWKTREEILSGSNELVSGKTPPFRQTTSPRDIFRKLMEYLGITGMVRQFPLTPGLINFVADFKPDVLYTHLGDIPMATLCTKLTEYFSLPLIVHIMDDYPSTLYRKGLFAGMVRSTMHRQLRHIFDRAAMRLCICQAMCDEYSARYKQKFIPYHNAVDLSVWGKDVLKDNGDKKSFKLAYSGRIGVSCLTSIQEVCKVVEGWNNSRVSITFDILVNDINQTFETAPFLRGLHPNVHVIEAPKSAEKIASLLKSADILLLPVDFDRDSIEYIRLSMPTKVPAYMATGIPVMVYGPSDVASVKYAKTQGWGYVIEERSSDALTESITRLCLDKELRTRLSERSRNLAALNHDGALIRSRFRETVAGAVRSK